jgi:two-component system, cell cycle sensor histidine kinase and response regulator CckA
MNKDIRILVVDDDPSTLDIIAFLLRSSGYSVIQASTGEECLQLVKKERPDLILLDVDLPGLDGIEVCRRIKTDPETSRIFVIHISSYQISSISKIKGLESGADDYLTLPIDNDELLARVNAMVRLKIAEESLRNSEKRFRSLIENVLDIITILNRDGTISYESPSVERVLGYKPEELIGRPVFEFIHPDDLQNVKNIFNFRVQTPGIGTTKRLRYRHKNGSWCTLEIIGSNLLDDPEIAGIVINSRDITEREQAEEKIHEQAALLNITQDAILVHDLEGRILFWNKGAERNYGWTAEEATGHYTYKLLHQEQSLPPKLMEIFKNVIENGSWIGELNQFTKEGKEVVVESRRSLVRDNEGKPKSILVVNTDITEKKKLEVQFLRTQRMESLGTLASGIAHDLNNVLAPVLMSLELLKNRLPDKESLQILKTLETNTERGASLVKKVLSFSRGLEGERGVIQLKNFVSEFEKVIRGTFPRSIEIRLDISDDLWTLSADAMQLHQVLMNLCVNARDAMNDRGTLTISARNFLADENYTRMNIDSKAGPYIVITVLDTGSGISNTIMDRIFEPFFTTKGFGKGSGLGLSTVIGIVRSHGGFVNVQSELGKGTEIKVYLPALESAETEQAKEECSHLPLGQGELILVVDDEASIREITKASLEAFNYRVLTAGDGIEAVAVYAEHKENICAVLLDMMMPLMDGPATIRALQRIKPTIKIIAASGLASNYKMDDSIRNAVEAFLSKPYTAEELLRALSRALGQNN